jgi:hypothetical protein
LKIMKVLLLQKVLQETALLLSLVYLKKYNNGK